MATRIEGDTEVYCLWLREFRQPDWFCTVTLDQVRPYFERLSRFVETLSKGDA